MAMKKVTKKREKEESCCRKRSAPGSMVVEGIQGATRSLKAFVLCLHSVAPVIPPQFDWSM